MHPEETEWVKIADMGDIDEEEIALVEIAGEAVLIVLYSGVVIPLVNQCPCRPKTAPQTPEEIDSFATTCPVHGIRFDLGSGEPFDPIGRGKFSIAIRNSEIMLQCSWHNKCWEPNKQGEKHTLREELKSIMEYESSEHKMRLKE